MKSFLCPFPFSVYAAELAPGVSFDKEHHEGCEIDAQYDLTYKF